MSVRPTSDLQTEVLLVRLNTLRQILEITKIQPSFRFTNRSDKDLYASQLKFRIHSRTLSGKDFLINIPIASRKAYGEGVVGAPSFADIRGLLCHDSLQRPVFSIFVFHLAPHESREITITNGRAGSAKVGATTGFFSTTPQPLNVNGNVDSTPFR